MKLKLYSLDVSGGSEGYEIESASDTGVILDCIGLSEVYWQNKIIINEAMDDAGHGTAMGYKKNTLSDESALILSVDGVPVYQLMPIPEAPVNPTYDELMKEVSDLYEMGAEGEYPGSIGYEFYFSATINNAVIAWRNSRQ